MPERNFDSAPTLVNALAGLYEMTEDLQLLVHDYFQKDNQFVQVTIES